MESSNEKTISEMETVLDSVAQESGSASVITNLKTQVIDLAANALRQVMTLV